MLLENKEPKITPMRAANIMLEAHGLHKFATNTIEKHKSSRAKLHNIINIPHNIHGLSAAVRKHIRVPRAQSVERMRNNVCVAARAGALAGMPNGLTGIATAAASATQVAVIAEGGEWLGRAIGRPIGAVLAHEICHIGTRRATVRKVVEHVIDMQEGVKRLKRMAQKIGGKWCPAVVGQIISKLGKILQAPIVGFVQGAKEEINLLNAKAEKIFEEQKLDALKKQDETEGIIVDADYLKTEIRKALSGNSQSNNGTSSPTEIIHYQDNEVSEAEEVMAAEADKASVKIKPKKQRQIETDPLDISDENLAKAFGKIHKRGGALSNSNYVDSIIDDYFFTVDINGQTYLAEPHEIPVINEILSSKANPENNNSVANGGTRKTRKFMKHIRKTTEQ